MDCAFWTTAATAVSAVSSLFYLAVLGTFAAGVARMRVRGEKDRVAPDGRWPSASVAVPLRNEERNLGKTLEALAAQDYPGEWEVICVDDRSDDATPRLLAEFAASHPRFSVLTVPADAPETPSPKKRALEKAFSAAKGEILMTIDADCLPPERWLRSMVSNFRAGIDIVQGPKRILPGKGILSKVQALETLGFTLIEGAFFTLGKPMLASAPSLAYRRSVYDASGGLAALEGLVSGDDDMLVQRMSRHAAGVAYNADPEAQVRTWPAETWREFFSQRARWASNGTRYESRLYVLMLAAIYLFFVFLAASVPLAAATGIPALLLPLATKVAVDLLFLAIGARKLRSLGLLRAYPPTLLVQVVVVLWAPLAGAFGWYRWKGKSAAGSAAR